METPIDVRALRDRLGWSQAKLAEYLGVDQSSVSRMEARTGMGRPLRGPARRLLEQLAAQRPGEAA